MGADTVVFTDASGTYTNDWFFSGTGGNDTFLIDGQSNGDYFDLSGMELASPERLEFDDNGSNFDVTVELPESELTLTGSEIDDQLMVIGVDQTGSTENIIIDLATTTEVDLSGWVFTDWGGQGETVRIEGDSSNEKITGSVADDTIDGGAGNDTLDGVSGTDTVSYASASAGVTVDLFI